MARAQNPERRGWGSQPGTAHGPPPLSRTPVENHRVDRVYDRLAAVYDLFFGPTLQAGRERMIEHMAAAPGDRILEVGIGTGLSTRLYPPGCEVVGIDFSAPMLAKAHRRIRERGHRQTRLLRMDAAHLAFPDGCFDIVHAAYVLSVVAEPVRVAREMYRVCRPGGKVLILNHFLSHNPLLAGAERLLSPLTVHLGFRSDVDLEVLLAQAGSALSGVERVSFRGLWTLLEGVKGAA